MSPLHFIHIAQQIEFIFIVVIQMKVLREESKGKATNNLLTLYSIPFLFCHVCKIPCLERSAVLGQSTWLLFKRKKHHRSPFA